MKLTSLMMFLNLEEGRQGERGEEGKERRGRGERRLTTIIPRLGLICNICT